MIKKFMIVIGLIIGVIVLIGAVGIYYTKPNEQLILDFIKKNPDKAAIKLIRNDTIIAEKNSNRMMPLASTVKIIIAIEYAIQSAKGEINPNEEVSIEQLAKFYVHNTDGGAHPKWLESVKTKINNNSISIREIAKGMIRYSSNANTEWLSQKLGLQKINKRIESLGITDHTEIYYIVSALFVGKEKFPNIKGEDLENKLRDLSIEEYKDITNKVHSKLATDTIYKSDKGDLGMNIQRIWSDNLPASTVHEYATLMQKLNSKSYFDSKTHEYLDEVMEGLMENPANQKWLTHAGMKGGSTAFVLTKAFYATDKKGNKTELAYFFNDLGIIQNTRLRNSMNQFELTILTNKEFREKIEITLRN
ncbi:serine hydrolase [Aquimarina litoralis]|uniref:serine hydrolase n=1 Tax=Aquimarina litoralis TaxID=584605 RepID=UPI001C58F436|nr:serine hydrolase [Aquimarina litoralis]MBW1294005.1 D-alanyl-D-alanine carboxypeptidase [Aquimarina litoralis]